LNHLPEVKKFIHEQIVPGRWHRVSVEWIGGHAPTAYFQDSENNVVEEVSLEALSFGDIAKLLEARGFGAAPAVVKDEI
jgi:hypothetical protein